MTDNVDSRVPVTIDELRDYCNKSGISLYQLNFYLGSDHIGSNAHGIYKDYWTGDFITYKNLEDGSKEVIYQGTDEAEGVKKLYDCLLNVLQNAEKQNTSERFGTVDKVYAEQEKLRSLIESINSKEENQASYGDSIYSEASANPFGDESYDEAGSESVEDESYDEAGSESVKDESYDETDSNSYEDGSYSEEENSDAFGDSSYGEEENVDAFGDNSYSEANLNSYEDGSYSEEENVDEFGNSSYDDTNTEPLENTYRSNQDSDSYVESIYRTDGKSSLFGDSSASGEEKDVFEDAYSIEDVKDLKTGVVYFFSKLTYYLSRLCYYISGIIFALSRVLIGVSHTLGKRVLELDKSYVNEKVTEENVEKINKAVETGFFDKSGYDDKAQLLLDKTKYYTSRLFFHISKLSLRFSRYCYKTSDNVYDPEVEGKTANRNDTTKDENVIAGRENNVKSASYEYSARKASAYEENTSNTADNEYSSKAPVNEYTSSQTTASNNDYTKGIVRERTEDNTYYAQPQRDLHSLIKGIDPDVEILKPESSYDLSKIAEEYDTDDDDSLKALTGSLNEDNFDYSDYNDDYEDGLTNEQIMKFCFGLIAAIILFIYFMASTNSSGFNEYGRSISSSFSRILNW